MVGTLGKESGCSSGSRVGFALLSHASTNSARRLLSRLNTHSNRGDDVWMGLLLTALGLNRLIGNARA